MIVLNFVILIFINFKDEIMENFEVYKMEVELQCETFIKYVGTDGSGEYYDPSNFESTSIIY